MAQQSAPIQCHGVRGEWDRPDGQRFRTAIAVPDADILLICHVARIEHVERFEFRREFYTDLRPVLGNDLQQCIDIAQIVQRLFAQDF